MDKKNVSTVNRVKDFIITHQLLEPGDRVLVAVSGGADSVGLLLILKELREELAIRFYAAHFDHQLRPESASEGDFTENLAKSLGIEIVRGKKDIGALAKKGNLQDIARRERYLFLRKAAENLGTNKIATAHHGEDQAETVLLHLLRGSGAEGLSAISPLENDIIRPLLCLEKKEIEYFLNEKKQGFCLDESNLGDKYLRNNLRHHLLPFLKEYNPQVVQALGITADILREENRLLALATVGALEDVRTVGGGISLAKLIKIPLALKRRVLRLAYQEYVMPRGLFPGGLSFERTEAALSLMDGQKLALPKGIWLFRQGNQLLFSQNLPAEEDRSFEAVPVQLGGWRPLCGGAWEYRAEIVEDTRKLINAGAEAMVLPPEWLARLSFRSKKQGDIFSPAKMGGHKKVKKIFQEYRVPQNKRAAWPLLLLDREIVWIPGLRKGVVEEPEQNGLVIICRNRDDKGE